MKPKSWNETALALKAPVVDSLHRYSFWQRKYSRLSSPRQHGVHSKCTNLLDRQGSCCGKGSGVWAKGYPISVNQHQLYFFYLYLLLCLPIHSKFILHVKQIYCMYVNWKYRYAWCPSHDRFQCWKESFSLTLVWFVSPQFVVITVCLKAGLETSSWTMVSWWLSPLLLKFCYLFPIPSFYLTIETCKVLYILFLSPNLFMVWSHWACNYKPREMTWWKLLQVTRSLSV